MQNSVRTAPFPGHTVTLVGTPHLANPGLDLITAEIDDVLASSRQRELDAVAEWLCASDPDRIVVEFPADQQELLSTVYDRYRTGELRFDEIGHLPEPLTAEFCRNEVIQIGMRCACQLGHDRIIGADHTGSIPAFTTAEAVEAVVTAVPDPADVTYPVPDPTAVEAEQARHFEEDELIDIIRWINEPEQLRVNHALLFAIALEHDVVDDAIGQLVAWYERNLRTVHTLYRELAPEDRRVLLVFGSGHIRILHHLLDEAPMFRPKRLPST